MSVRVFPRARNDRAVSKLITNSKLIKKAGLLTVAGCLTVTAGVIGQSTAQAQPRHRPAAAVTVITEGLNGPRQLSKAGGRFLVAESDSGRIVSVDPRRGGQRTLFTGLSTPQGVSGVGGKVYIATGEAAPDAEPATPEASGSALLVGRPGPRARIYPSRQVRLFADLLEYELHHNPDGQIQFGPDGQPLDALSNPYYVLRDRSRRGHLLVADAGANAVLAVDHRGRTSTYYVPPTIRTGACATVPNNNAKGFGCDAVPTGLAYGPGGRLYISALTSEVPGEGRVYVLDRRGRLITTIRGFSAPTGVAVDHRGTVYVSELLEGAPTGEQPPPGFDPAAVGQIVKVPPFGRRSYAQVTMPSGLLWSQGSLYASAWSIGSFLGISDAGQVVKVRGNAFTQRPAR